MDLKSPMSEKSFNTYPNKRVSSGIKGLDEMLGGGFPSGHIIVVIGDSGTGKTTLALQFIFDGLLKGESAIYITIEEEKESIISNAANYGWDMEKYIQQNKLGFLKLDLSDISTAARQVQTQLPLLINSFGAKRMVIDSITLFDMVFEDYIEKRIRLVGLNSAVKKAGITAIYTAESSVENPNHSKNGVVEYTADGIIVLHQDYSARKIKLNMRVIKMRRTWHEREFRLYEITGHGIDVHEVSFVQEMDIIKGLE